MINQLQTNGGSKPAPYSSLSLSTFADLRTAARAVPTGDFYEIFIFITTLKKVLTFRLVNANILPTKSQENKRMGKFSFAVEYFYFYFINFFGKVIMSFAAKQVA